MNNIISTAKELTKWLNCHCSSNQKVTYSMCKKFVKEQMHDQKDSNKDTSDSESN